jgi:hypothetical protein
MLPPYKGARCVKGGQPVPSRKGLSGARELF